MLVVDSVDLENVGRVDVDNENDETLVLALE